tara:strand:- start:724 stop:1497 length:774 start_codon:yes stop_codon:yes gene_type:complete
MRNYNNEEPIIFNHIPKCGGSTVSLYFKNYLFKGNYHPYYVMGTGIVPEFPKADKLDGNSIITSHFNYKINPIEQVKKKNYSQFFTILRDPLEMAISMYYYQRSRKNFINWPLKTKLKWILEFGFSQRFFNALKKFKEKPVHHISLDDYLLTKKEIILDFLPRGVNSKNYEDYFERYYICLGITNRLSHSLKLFAKKINKNFNEDDISSVNITKSIKLKPSALVKEKFINQNKTSYLIYKYAQSRFEQEYSKVFSHK